MTCCTKSLKCHSGLCCIIPDSECHRSSSLADVTPEAFAEPDDPLFPVAVLRSAGLALEHAPLRTLNNNALPPRFLAEQRTNLPEPLQTLLNTLCPLLLFKARPLQVTVYQLLDK